MFLLVETGSVAGEDMTEGQERRAEQRKKKAEEIYHKVGEELQTRDGAIRSDQREPRKRVSPHSPLASMETTNFRI